MSVIGPKTAVQLQKVVIKKIVWYHFKITIKVWIEKASKNKHLCKSHPEIRKIHSNNIPQKKKINEKNSFLKVSNYHCNDLIGSLMRGRFIRERK